MFFHERLNFRRKYPDTVALLLHLGYENMNTALSYFEILPVGEKTIACLILFDIL